MLFKIYFCYIFFCFCFWAISKYTRVLLPALPPGITPSRGQCIIYVQHRDGFQIDSVCKASILFTVIFFHVLPSTKVPPHTQLLCQIISTTKSFSLYLLKGRVFVTPSCVHGLHLALLKGHSQQCSQGTVFGARH